MMLFDSLIIFPIMALTLVLLFLISRRSLLLTSILMIITLSVGTIYVMNDSFDATKQTNWVTVFYMVIGSAAIGAIIDITINELQKRSSKA